MTNFAPALRLVNLGLRRNGRWLVRGLNLDVPAGQFLAVVGPSGVGKSSLLACLSGQLPPDEGRLEIFGAAQSATAASRNGDHSPMAMIFQHGMLCANDSALENVLCGRLARHPWWRTLWGFPRQERHWARRWLVELGLGTQATRPVRLLSGGEQQRVGVARAFFQEGEIFLADEPVSHLDAYFAGRVLGLLRQESRRTDVRRAVVCVLHDSALVERFADSALALNPGQPEGWSLRAIGHPAGAATATSAPN